MLAGVLCRPASVIPRRRKRRRGRFDGKTCDIVRQPRRVEDVAVHETVALVTAFDADIGIFRCVVVTQSRAIEIRAVGGCCGPCHVKADLGLSPADHLAVDPQRLARSGIIGEAGMEHEIIGDDAAVTLCVEAEFAGEYTANDLDGAAI